MSYKEGDLVIANDDLNIVNDCIGEIHSIDKSNNGEKIYTVKFDTGTFLLKKNQIIGKVVGQRTIQAVFE